MPFNSRHWNPRYVDKCFKEKDSFRGAIRYTADQKQAWKMEQIQKIQHTRQATNDSPSRG